MRSRLMTAVEVLGRALLEIADQGQATPCQGRRADRWTSDDAEARGWAATVCVTLACPVLPSAMPRPTSTTRSMASGAAVTARRHRSGNMP